MLTKPYTHRPQRRIKQKYTPNADDCHAFEKDWTQVPCAYIYLGMNMCDDFLTENGYLFLGSRLRRLGEQLQAEANRASQDAGIDLPVGKLPFLARLADHGPQTVGNLANLLGLSQPVTTRGVDKLIELGLISDGRADGDGRSRVVSLTADGERLIARSRDLVWPRVEAAVRQIAEGLSGNLLDQLADFERALTDQPLDTRVAATRLIVAEDDDVPAVVALMNRAYRSARTGWNSEAAYIAGDRTSQALLRADLVAKPDATLLVWPDDEGLKGCVWLEPLGGGVWYLGSLAVDPDRQKAGLGHILLTSAEHWLRGRGGDQVRITVVNVRDTLIAWYERRGYVRTGEISPFPYGEDRFGTPLRDDLAFVVLEKALRP